MAFRYCEILEGFIYTTSKLDPHDAEIGKSLLIIPQFFCIFAMS